MITIQKVIAVAEQTNIVNALLELEVSFFIQSVNNNEATLITELKIKKRNVNNLNAKN